MKCRTTRNLEAVPWWESPLLQSVGSRRIVPSGTEIDEAIHPECNCVALVRNGEAIPLDDECRAACGLTPAQIVAAVAARKRLEEGEEDTE